MSVERVREYQETPQEAAFSVPQVDPLPSWPPEGEIIFQDYATRYRNGMDLVLRGVSFHIRPQQKVGIVGRTGAGKSSLTLALFRIIEAAQGAIFIDGLNISQMGLERLRQALTIIPQVCRPIFLRPHCFNKASTILGSCAVFWIDEIQFGPILQIH